MAKGSLNVGLWLLVGGCGLGLGSGCALHSGQVRTDELALERARAAHAEVQVELLEARLEELEQQVATRAEEEAKAREAQAQTLAKLDQLLAAHEQLATRLEQAQQPVAAKPSDQAGVLVNTSGNPALTTYLQQLVERAESGAPPWRGGLSFEKREALRVLLETERNLDVGNPMAL
jgi:hypothetical protein